MSDATRPSSTDNGRLHSSSTVWANFPRKAICFGEADGFWFRDDYFRAGVAEATTLFDWIGGTGSSGPMRYDGFGSAGVLMKAEKTAAGEHIGVLQITTNADDEEAKVTFDATYCDTVAEITDTAGDNFMLAAECRLRVDNLGTDTSATTGMFFGLGVEGAATGMMAANAATIAGDFVGFRKSAADYDGMDCVVYDSAETVVLESADSSVAAQTITADTYVKLGLNFDGKTVRWYVNGVEVASTTISDTAQIPDGKDLAPQFGVRQHGTGTFLTEVDWMEYGVWRNVLRSP